MVKVRPPESVILDWSLRLGCEARTGGVPQGEYCALIGRQLIKQCHVTTTLTCDWLFRSSVRCPPV